MPPLAKDAAGRAGGAGLSKEGGWSLRAWPQTAPLPTAVPGGLPPSRHIGDRKESRNGGEVPKPVGHDCNTLSAMSTHPRLVKGGLLGLDQWRARMPCWCPQQPTIGGVALVSAADRTRVQPWRCFEEGSAL